MKNKDLFRLAAGFKAVANLPGVKFAYAVAKNTRMVDAVIADLRKSVEPDEAFKTYNTARLELAKSHAVIENDKPKITTSPQGDAYEILDQAAFDAALADLQALHGPAIDRQTAKNAELEKLLEEEADADLKLYTIKIDLVPDSITPAQLESIFEIIDE